MSSSIKRQEQQAKDVQEAEAARLDAAREGASAPVQEDVQEAPVTEAPEAPGAYSVEALAERVGASQKDVRRWLRARVRDAGRGDILPGKGGRYAFDGATLEALARAYGASKASKGTHAPGVLIASLLAPSAPSQEAPQA